MFTTRWVSCSFIEKGTFWMGRKNEKFWLENSMFLEIENSWRARKDKYGTAHSLVKWKLSAETWQRLQSGSRRFLFRKRSFGVHLVLLRISRAVHLVSAGIVYLANAMYDDLNWISVIWRGMLSLTLVWKAGGVFIDFAFFICFRAFVKNELSRWIAA